VIRVLHVIDHLGLGGAQSALLDIVRHRSCVEAEVACMHGHGPFASALAAEGIRVHSLAPRRASPVYALNFMRLAKGGGFDVFHFHLQGANWLAKPLAAMVAPGAFRIAHDHASGDLRFRGLHSLLPDAISHLASHHIIAVSQGVSDFLTRCEAIPQDKISVVPNGIDTQLFHPPSPAERTEARRHLNLPAHQFLIGALGRLAPEKNFQAIPRIARLLPDCYFVIGGEGPCLNEIRGEAKRMQTADRVVLAGKISDRPAFFAAMDAFVIPSLYEGLPMVLLEAMASGLPVVASDLADMRNALSPCGLLRPPGNDPAFADALNQLITNRPSATALGATARAHCTERFSAHATAGAIESIYRAACRE
jgi:glycosyltransferase involved in cell wall biosynthesis